MRLLPQYRGIRVKPYMRFFNFILYGFFVFLLLPATVVFAFLNLSKLESLDTVALAIFSILLVTNLSLPIWLVWFVQEYIPLFNRFDRLSKMSRFLYEHGYTYTKKGSNGQQKIKFPKVYVKQGKFDLDISFEMAGSKFQDKFKKIGGALEDTLFMDFMETEDEPRYKIYKMAYSALLNRVKGSELIYDLKKGINLMKNFFWDFHENPHLLVAGGTGGGKTVFLRFLVTVLGKIGIVYIGDPKRADFATMGDLKAFKNRVFFEREDIVKMFENAKIIMEARYDEMRRQAKAKGDKDLGKYYEYGLKPVFVICDEYNGFINSLDYRQRDRVESAVINITLLGRQAGVNIILAAQKPGTEDIPSKVRDNMMMRFALGRLAQSGYDMVFGEASKDKEFKYIKRVQGHRVYGRGYAAVNGEVAREFYSPFWEKGYSFFDEFEKLEFVPNPQSPTEGDVDVEALKKDESLQSMLKNMAEGVAPVIEVEEEKLISVSDLAKELNKQPIDVRKMTKAVEEADFVTFYREGGKVLLSSEQAVMIKELLDKKETYAGSLKELVIDYFTE